ncbi:YfhO family protein, partial [candidate division KSB1 bacterium]|nr:YfhO family protein [candidate division KSB1 bacterium]
SDALKMVILLGLAILGFFGFIKKKIGQIGFIALLLLLIIVDLWWVDFKIINDKFEQNQAARIPNPTQYFQSNAIVDFMKQQQENEIFRIYPADTQDHNWYMYHQIPSIFGYNPAKIKIYQETLEALQLGPNMQRMLNTKYVLSNRDLPGYRLVPQFASSRPKVYESLFYLPRAFFVNRDTVISRAGSYDAHKNQILNFMKSTSFDPGEMAILEEKPPLTIEASGANSVKITDYDIHRIELQASVAKSAHLVLSEIYYPAGWKAYIDGEETKIYKTNYILRSIFLEPGEHKIEFIFNPLMFRLGLWLSIGTFLVLIGIVVFYIVKRKAQ